MKSKTKKILIGAGVGLGILLVLRSRSSDAVASGSIRILSNNVGTAATTREGAIKLAGLGSLG